MAYNRSSFPRQASSSIKNQLLLAIGGHAFVNLPHLGKGSAQSAPMNDDHGQSVANDLHDGEEVEILAWRPQASDGVTYQIRRLSDRSEWWLRAVFLRKRATADQAKVGSTA